MSDVINQFSWRDGKPCPFVELLVPEPVLIGAYWHSWASNFYPVGMPNSAAWFVENLFQASKASNSEDSMRVMAASSPGEAKKIGRSIKLRNDWEEVKDAVMRGLLVHKFIEKPLADALRATAGIPLVEGNTWGDRYWGTVNGIGQNKLGLLLMDVRAQLLVNNYT